MFEKLEKNFCKDVLFFDSFRNKLEDLCEKKKNEIRERRKEETERYCTLHRTICCPPHFGPMYINRDINFQTKKYLKDYYLTYDNLLKNVFGFIFCQEGELYSWIERQQKFPDEIKEIIDMVLNNTYRECKNETEVAIYRYLIYIVSDEYLYYEVLNLRTSRVQKVKT